jgi:C-terminal processing protease CtpA/Prc
MNINGYGGPQYTSDELLAQLEDASSASGLVIDGRGYPGVDTTELVARIVGGPAPSPRYGFPSWSDASSMTLDEVSDNYPAPTGAPYTKPVALLVGPWTQSSAENLAMVMMQRPSLKVVGRQTSGSDGNITSVVLPGGLGISFTGMRVNYADGGQFHGVGVHLTTTSTPTAADYAAGIDRELVDGIAAVRGP